MTDSAAFAEEARKFRIEHPDVVQVEAVVSDSNGLLRGKWLRAEALDSLAKKGMRLPSSVFGETVRLVGDLQLMPGVDTRDSDGLFLPVPGTLRPMPWRIRPSAQVLMAMHCPDDSPTLDPRQILVAEERRWRKRGWTPVVGVELEFCLLPRPSAKRPGQRPPERELVSRLLEIDGLKMVEPVLADICQYAEAQEVPLTTCVAEFAPAQYELNLGHVKDAARAGDLAVQFKRLVKEAASRHGMDATFMAQPLDRKPGNGFHVHVSVANRKGQNLFNEPGSKAEAPMLLSAVEGCIRSFADFQLVFAPHANSYRRLVPNLGKIQRVGWGRDDREASVRLPEWSGPAARLEHRLGGADAQPYLLIAAVLFAMREGMEEGLAARPPKGSPGGLGPRLTPHWHQATERFARSAQAERLFGRTYRDMYAMIKRMEAQEAWERVTDREYETLYLRI